MAAQASFERIWRTFTYLKSHIAEYKGASVLVRGEGSTHKDGDDGLLTFNSRFLAVILLVTLRTFRLASREIRRLVEEEGITLSEARARCSRIGLDDDTMGEISELVSSRPATQHLSTPSHPPSLLPTHTQAVLDVQSAVRGEMEVPSGEKTFTEPMRAQVSKRYNTREYLGGVLWTVQV